MAEPNGQPLLHQRRVERKAFPDRRVGVNGWKLVILAVGVGLLLVGFFFWRAHQSASADRKLCLKIDKATVAWIKLVRRQPVPPKGSKQLRLRHEFLDSMKAALCDPKNLPTTKR